MSEIEEYDGKKAKFLEDFKFLRPDLAFPENWTQEQKDQVLEEIRPGRVKTAMFAAIPMNCTGPRCPFASTCPLQQKDIAPIGKPCPLEGALISEFAQNYMEELNVDPDNLIEVSMVRDLVDQEVQYMRKTKVLAKEYFIQENVMGVSQQGEIILKKELHLAVELEDRLHRRKKELRNQLLATREARAKAGIGQIDTALAINDIVEKAREIEFLREKKLKAAMAYDEVIDAEIVNEEG